MAAVSIVIFRKTGSSGYWTFVVPRRLVCLFVLRFIPGVFMSMSFFASLSSRLMVPLEVPRVEGRAYLVFSFFVSARIFSSVRSRWPSSFTTRWLTLLLDYAMGQGPLRFRLESLYEHTIFLLFFFSSEILLLDRYIPSAFLQLAEGRFSSRRCFQHVVLHPFQSGPINYTAVSIITLGPVEVV
jgi:hypothetical protein